MTTSRVTARKTSAISFVQMLQSFIILEVIVIIMIMINTHRVIDKNDAKIMAMEASLQRAMTIVIPSSKAMDIIEVEDVKVHNVAETSEITIITFGGDTLKEIAQEEKATDEENKPILNTSDKELLAQIMFAEEGVFLKQYAKDPEMVERVFKLAGSVVLNRVKTNYMGANSISDVIYTKGQYAKQTQDRVRDGQEVPDIVYVWAEDLITDGTIGPEGLIYQAEFDQGQVYERIGNQVFGTR